MNRWITLSGIGLALVAFAYTRSQAFAGMPIPYDDAFITFRIASTSSIYFNEGVRMWTHTSPLWLAVCSSIHAIDPTVSLFSGLPMWARTIALCLEFSVGAVVVWALRSKPVLAVVFAFAWAINPRAALLGPGGMETAILILLVALSVIYKSWWWVFLLSVTRPEGWAFAAVIVAFTRQRPALIALAAGAFVWLVNVYYFGGLPASIVAKFSAYIASAPTHRSWYYLDWIIPAGCGGRTGPLTMEANAAAGLGAFMVWALVVGKGLARWVGLAAIAMAAVHAVAGTPPFPWYLTAMYLVVMVCAALSIVGLPDRRAVAFALIPILGGITLAKPQAADFYRTVRPVALMAEKMASDGVANSLSAEPIGYVGWLNRSMAIYDHVGLTDNKIVRGGSGWLYEQLQRTSPDALVLRRHEVETGESQSGWGRLYASDEQREWVEANYYEVWSSHYSDPMYDIVLFYNRSISTK